MEKKYSFKETGFESYVNKDAMVVIVGITPGKNQLGGKEERLTPFEIKQKYAFRGKGMRSNLIELLDFVGVNELLGIPSCDSIWENNFHLVEFTSLLKRATFVKVNGEMFNKAEKIASNLDLKEELNKGFLKDCALYHNVKLFVACGPGVYGFLKDLYNQGVLNAPVVEIAHPSGQNGNWIACYLKRKQADSKTLKKCEGMRNEAIAQVQSLINV